jgi:hypothetical protein
MNGLITGKGDGKWGRIKINRDGSLLLENVTLSDVKITNCDLHAESGECPIPFGGPHEHPRRLRFRRCLPGDDFRGAHRRTI